MTDTEKILKGLEILRNHSQDEVYGDFKDVVDGTYNVVISNVYGSINSNGKEFIGIKSTIEDGDYAGDFFVDCIYLNDEAYERNLYKIRNVLLAFNLSDLSEEDIRNFNFLSRLSELKGKKAKVTVESNQDLNSYYYECR